MKPGDKICDESDFTIEDIIYTRGRYDRYLSAVGRSVDVTMPMSMIAFRNVEKALIAILGKPPLEEYIVTDGLPMRRWSDVGEWHSGVWVMLQPDGSILVRPPHKQGGVPDVIVEEAMPASPSAETQKSPQMKLDEILSEFRAAKAFKEEK